MSRDPGIWTAALLTLVAWSYLLKQNILFQAVEHLFVGISAAHAMTVAFTNLRDTCLRPALSGEWTVIVPILGGLLLYTRFVPKISHLSRIPLAFTMGTAAGVVMTGSLGPSFIQQVSGTMVPLNSPDNAILVLGTVTTIAYFLFGRKSRSGVMDCAAKVGRYVMMASFGAAYGNTVMMRMSLLIPRIRLVFGDWLGLLP
ncbi:MAG TPA: hypothetical protein GX512_08125 [Firmicutes bacterium]|nr:hypothetical protein [Candidatus Fermentithermobacillaceae bacterium]